jgi:hypothetical protein
MNRTYLTAIIICKVAGAEKGWKYHNVQNTQQKLTTFMKFAAMKPGARYVNFYYKTTHRTEKGRNYAFRLYIE